MGQYPLPTKDRLATLTSRQACLRLALSTSPLWASWRRPCLQMNNKNLRSSDIAPSYKDLFLYLTIAARATVSHTHNIVALGLVEAYSLGTVPFVPFVHISFVTD